MLKILYTHISLFLNHISLENSVTKDKRRVTKQIGELLVNYGLKYFFNLHLDNYNIIQNEHGKPYISSPQNIYYNISHSGDYIVCVFSDKEVGIDIEKIGKARINVAKRYFHSAEINKLRNITENEQIKLFFQYWTIKESYLKYTGEGISGGLSSFEVQCEKEKIRLYKGEHLLPVSISYCNIDQEYLCYVASENYNNPEIIYIEKEKLIQAEADKTSACI